MTTLCSYTLQPDECVSSTLNQPWECPHEAVDNIDRCVFHLTPQERDELGINESEVVADFHHCAEQPGKRPKQFIGGQFNDINLSRAIIEATDKHSIDLRHASIEGTLDFSQTSIQQPFRLEHAEVQKLDFTETEFNSNLDIAGVTCHGEINAEAISIDGDVDARDTTFESVVTLDEARFHGDTCFKRTYFEKPVQFRGAEFRGDANLLDDDACFESAVFEADVAFTKTRFRYADFVDTQFKGNADFGEAIFKGDAEFKEATFEGDATFVGAEFHGDANVLIVDADFTDAEFHGDANFKSGQFRRASFDGATFTMESIFEDCRFNGQTTFRDVSFQQDTNLSETRFHDDVSFSNSIFERTLTLSGAEFHGGDNAGDTDLNFEDVTFRGLVKSEQIEATEATFEGAAFDDTVTFHEGIFAEEVSFANAEFSAEVEFTEVVFDGDASFEKCQFEERTEFAGAEFKGGNYVEDDDVTFSGATFHDRVGFQSCRFQYTNFDNVTVIGPADFTDARFSLDATLVESQWESKVRFLETRFQEDVDFEEAVFSGPALFRGTEFHGGANTEEDDLRFVNARFKDIADFNSAQFRFANFRHTEFWDTAKFSETHFDDDARFDDCTFQAKAIFDEARFHDDASFEATVFESESQFRGVEFQGGANVLDDDVAFDDARFYGNASFSHGEFGYADFSDAVFKREVFFDDTLFTDEAAFTNLEVADVADFDGATFVGVVTFQEADFGGRTRFDQVQFEKGAKFTDTAFRSDVEFTGTAFEDNPTDLKGDADFEQATFASTVAFDRAEVKSANFTETTFREKASFESVVFSQGATYDGADVKGEFIVSHSRFMGDTSIERVHFSSGAKFSGSIFSGGTGSETDAVSFDESVFDTEATFDDCEFQTASFIETVFTEGASFEDARFTQKMSFQAAPEGDRTLIDMRGAELYAGRITQPEAGSTFYDLTRTTVKDVTLESNETDAPLLDYFLFVETDFDGFDFSTHMRELSRNNWDIHGFRYDEVLADGGRAQRSGSLSWAELERTYLMAKNSASELGHRKAAAEFYIKEFTYRRKKNKDTFINGGVDTGRRKRLIAGGKWFGNLLLYETCGYGERIWRILYVSALVIATWAVLYLTVTQGTRGPGDVTTSSFSSISEIFTPEGITSVGHALYFSLVTFTTLGYGDVQPIGPTARLLASVESFLGALLVALVVFVIGRRMA